MTRQIVEAMAANVDAVFDGGADCTGGAQRSQRLRKPRQSAPESGVWLHASSVMGHLVRILREILITSTSFPSPVVPCATRSSPT